MVFGKKIDNMINEFGKELDVKYYGYNEYMSGIEKKQTLTDGDVRTVYINNGEKVIRISKYTLANGSDKVEIEFDGKLIKGRTQNEMIEKMLDFLTE
jgi:hypothetical protein